MSGAARGIPFHCPYCGDEDLRPSDEGHGAWECHSCLRVFSLKMLGMVPRPTLTAPPTTPPTTSPTPPPSAPRSALPESEVSA